MRLRLLSTFTVLVRVKADEHTLELSGANNPVTPFQRKRTVGSSQREEISPAVFHAQEICSAEG